MRHPPPPLKKSKLSVLKIQEFFNISSMNMYYLLLYQVDEEGASKVLTGTGTRRASTRQCVGVPAVRTGSEVLDMGAGHCSA